MKFSENELHAYVDDRLEGDARRAVEAYLAQAPEDAARVAAYREQNAYEAEQCLLGKGNAQE